MKVIISRARQVITEYVLKDGPGYTGDTACTVYYQSATHPTIDTDISICYSTCPHHYCQKSILTTLKLHVRLYDNDDDNDDDDDDDGDDDNGDDNNNVNYDIIFKCILYSS